MTINDSLILNPVESRRLAVRPRAAIAMGLLATLCLATPAVIANGAAANDSAESAAAAINAVDEIEIRPGNSTGADSAATARAVDASILSELTPTTLSSTDDATFLRRVSLDIIGRPATPGEITRFGLDPSTDKRSRVVSELLSSDEYASTWSRYWQDAIFRRATNVRAGIVRPAFDEWMSEQLASSRGWDKIVVDLLTADGAVAENGDTGLIFAHEGVPEEVAAEASRLFLGIQIQCANCHDHPWDKWKREQFHQFVAFFPRVSVRRDRNSDNMFDYEVASVDVDRQRAAVASQFLLSRIDRNRDGFISDAEAEGTQLKGAFARGKDFLDKNGDGKISINEILTAQPPDPNRPGQGATEHFMPDLTDPGSQGRKVDPAFFVGNNSVRSGMADAQRRAAVGRLITSQENIWFARAIVNRMWFEMTGTGFYTPIDDIGPDREVSHEAALQILCSGFVASGHDLKWLVRTIAATAVYQRGLNAEAEGFAHLEPMRLRSDQLYASLCQTLGVSGLPLRPTEGRRSPYEMRQSDPGQEEFARVFGFDPSTPRDELTGSIPEALMLMNSTLISQLISDRSPTSTISRLSTSVITDQDVISEMYLTAVGREPTASELEVAADYLQSSGNLREGLEDLLWALINSPEFMCKR